MIFTLVQRRNLHRHQEFAVEKRQIAKDTPRKRPIFEAFFRRLPQKKSPLDPSYFSELKKALKWSFFGRKPGDSIDRSFFFAQGQSWLTKKGPKIWFEYIMCLGCRILQNIFAKESSRNSRHFDIKIVPVAQNVRKWQLFKLSKIRCTNFRNDLILRWNYRGNSRKST